MPNTSEIAEEENKRVIDRLVATFQSMMASTVSASENCCIFTVPEILKIHSLEDFKPCAFSFGPYFHGSETTKGTEKVKIQYFQDFISRSESEQSLLFELKNAILEVEECARHCYAEPFDFNEEEFLQILVIDGIFIIEVLCMHYYGTEGGLVFNVGHMFKCLNHDLVLLENQIPWFVLEILYTFVKGPKPCLMTLAINFFSNIFYKTNVERPHVKLPNDTKYVHILDLLRAWLISTSTDMDSKAEWKPYLVTPFPSARKLKKVGIVFKRRIDHCMLDVKFENGILYIPPLIFRGNTGTIFHNFIAYEKYFPSCKSDITSYIIFLDRLIHTKDDMEILCENEIINNFLHREEATQFFSKLHFDTFFENYRYQKLSLEVDSYCNSFWPRHCALLQIEHLGKPWKVISLGVATIIVAAMIVQAIFRLIK